MSEPQVTSSWHDMRPGRILFVPAEPAMPDCPLAYYEEIVDREDVSTRYIVNMALMLLSEDQFYPEVQP